MSVSIHGDELTMTPGPDYFGTANITVTVSDGFLTDSETFELTINPVNDAPIANNDTYVTLEETELTVEVPGVMINDSDVDGDPLIVILINSVSNGGLTLNPDGSFEYQPNDGFNGFDGFSSVGLFGSSKTPFNTICHFMEYTSSNLILVLRIVEHHFLRNYSVFLH